SLFRGPGSLGSTMGRDVTVVAGLLSLGSTRGHNKSSENLARPHDLTLVPPTSYRSPPHNPIGNRIQPQLSYTTTKMA
ncbi:hypothetical protein HAX54_002839, partial [Datura stramonium]|nr:hypothetical protein [Datura stramonium]